MLLGVAYTAKNPESKHFREGTIVVICLTFSTRWLYIVSLGTKIGTEITTSDVVGEKLYYMFYFKYANMNTAGFN